MINEYLEILIPNQTISPRYLARKTRISPEVIKKLLMELSFRDLVDVRFIIRCDNDDPDMIHVREFNSEDDLLDFLRNPEKCSHCGSDLLTSNVQVSFVRKDFEKYQGAHYG